ncbi:MAG TPA: PPE domain-containing protein [Pseudonocardiaceae bacterium]|nr:PPE domain-containing protein [Pseudonocardiaceae bacterium]
MGTDIDYNTVAHETIYQHLTGGAGSIDMIEAARGWQGIAAKLQEIHGAVEEAVRAIGAAQQGAAADAASQATMTLLPWLGDGAAAANDTAIRISEQAACFGHARDNMPEPINVPEVSFSQDPATWLGDHAVEWLPGIQTGHEQAQVAAQQAEQRARELMSAYQGSSNDNLAASQHFAAAPVVVADVSDPSLAGSTGISGASASGDAPINPTHPGTAHPTSTIHNPATAGPAAAAAPAGTAPQIASGIHQAPAASTSPQLAGGYPGPQGQPMAGSSTVSAAAEATFRPSPGFTWTDAASGYRPGGRLQSSASGAVSRGGGFGPRPSAILGDAHVSASTAVLADAEHVSASRALRGGAGWEGTPFGAIGSSSRDSDTEHQRPSYLIEQDTNAIVGDLPRVAPPVIGADG